MGPKVGCRFRNKRGVTYERALVSVSFLDHRLVSVVLHRHRDDQRTFRTDSDHSIMIEDLVTDRKIDMYKISS